MSSSDQTELPLKDIGELAPEWEDAVRGCDESYLAVANEPWLMRWCTDVPLYVTQDFEDTSSKRGWPEGAEEIDPLFWPILNDAIDHLLVLQALEAVEDIERFLDEAVRVLKASGVVVFILPYRRRLFPLPARFAYRKASGAPIRFHRTDIVDMLTKAGFDVLNLRKSAFIKKTTGRKQALGRSISRAWSHQEGLLIIRARKRLYAPIKANYASRKKRFTLGKILPAGASAMK